MKILKYGEGYPKTAICPSCKSELEYELNDIQDYMTIYTDKTEHHKDIRCPVCGKQFDVYTYISYHGENP